MLNALPAIFTAIGILIIGYFLGRFVSEVVTSILTSLGFNNIFSVLGLPSPRRTAVYTEACCTSNYTHPYPIRNCRYYCLRRHFTLCDGSSCQYPQYSCTHSASIGNLDYIRQNFIGISGIWYWAILSKPSF